MPHEVITCRSLRHLDALVAEKLMGWRWYTTCDGSVYWFLSPSHDLPKPWDLSPSEAPPPGAKVSERYGTDSCPHYTTWPGLEPVIRNREEAGYWVSMEGACGLGMTPDEPDAAFHKMRRTQEASYATGPTIPIAVCLAALASAGCRVRLELGEP
jgi:hypothetical protein